MSTACSPMLAFQSTPPIRGATLDGIRLTASLLFQSTPPIRGATQKTSSQYHLKTFQSTPPIRGATYALICQEWFRDISIHAPHTGGDLKITLNECGNWHFNPRPPYGGRPSDMPKTWMDVIFQSTPPIRGATRRPILGSPGYFISIHAPHTGGDASYHAQQAQSGISIHAPHTGGD